MSYILDALKKAEAERHQGAIPTLHVQPAAALPADIGSLNGRKHLALLAGGMLLAASGLLVWLQPWQATPPVKAATGPQPPLAPAAIQPPDMPGAAPTVTAVAPKPVTTPAPVPAKPKSTELPAPAAATTRLIEPAGKRVAAAIPAPQPASPSLASTALPSDFPSISLGGYIYSDNPSERQLLVNRRLMHEGEEVMPGLILEKMLPKAAVFNYRGYRYQIAY